MVQLNWRPAVQGFFPIHGVFSGYTNGDYSRVQKDYVKCNVLEKFLTCCVFACLTNWPML